MNHLFAALLLAAQFTPEQKSEIEGIVKDYIISNPQVLVEASQNLQKIEQEKHQQKIISVITSKQKEFFGDDNLIIGDKTAPVTIIEFVDYLCHSCKKMAPIVEKVLKENKNVRLIVKPLAFVGQNSTLAAKAAFASRVQEKFPLLHQALFQSDKPLSKEQILSLAKSVGLNVEDLQKQMETIEDLLKNDSSLAEELGLQGTPFLIIAAYPNPENKKAIIFQGAVSESKLVNAIKEVLGK
jgi:protein-disulfide isomerase